VNLEELARTTSTLDESSFKKKYPSPALVFLGSSVVAAEGLNVDTPSNGHKVARFSKTNSMKVTDAFPAFDPNAQTRESREATVAKETFGAAAVIFLAKTDRNPFASMITVGRATNNDVCLPLQTVSKLHAYFTKLPTGWRIYDQRATNGTLVDEVRLAPGDSLPVTDGTRIALGPDAKARFYAPEGLFGFLKMYRAGIVA
jgi:hypothetical protein